MTTATISACCTLCAWESEPVTYTYGDMVTLDTTDHKCEEPTA